MIFEKRTYRVSAGKAAEFLKLYEAEGLGIITKYARLVGCWTTESGPLNSIVFLWGYDSFAHRCEQRAKLGADADWQGFVPKILPYLEYQESVFLTPAAFSPIK
ncbi:NIPSNAP family protein [Acidimangrovimonas pyrenivorans]|uniref:NIPSNAP family protein n=1 Tax=Acidimangrovimonas pyrenivorans TaxID=2030798 RepID=A0ABV7AJG5_9RHOB